MSRYLLDTNILIYLLTGDFEELSSDTENILFDYGNLLNTSSICILELIQLVKIKKISSKKYKQTIDFLNAVEEMNISILAFDTNHTKIMSKLKLSEKHNDPFDHAIISHSISEKLTLISSDKKFDFYQNQGLKFHFNRR